MLKCLPASRRRPAWRLPVTALAIGACLGVRAAGQLTPAESAPSKTFVGKPSAPFVWTAATPESQGISSARVAALFEHLRTHHTEGFLLARNDRIIAEWYAPGRNAGTKFGTASMAKAVIGGVGVALGLDQGRLALDDRAAKFIPQWRADPVKSRITIRQLGSHTSGLDDAEAGGLPHEKLTGWPGDFWKRLPPPRDPFTLARDVTPIISAPGTEWHYSNPGIAMLTYATTAAFGGRSMRTLLREHVFRPIGVRDEDWSAGYDKPVSVDGWQLVPAWGGAALTLRASASVGRLMMREGDWDGRRILSASAIAATTHRAGTVGRNGIGWWTNAGGELDFLPRDAFWGAGAGCKVVVVIPSLRVIAVRGGGALDPANHDNEAAIAALLFKPLMDALDIKPRIAE